METIKFKKSDAILVAIIIILIIAFAIIAFKTSGKEQENEAKKKEQEKKNRLIKLIERWEKLTEQISIEIKSLKLTQEMEAMLEGKISRYIIITKISFFMSFVTLVAAFSATGMDPITAALNTTGILGICFFGGSLLIANKFAEPNVVVESLICWVRKSVYKKYGYDPALIPALQESINVKQIEVDHLQSKIIAEDVSTII
jgi:cbb3-type cytochrome oxidase subunit 3